MASALLLEEDMRNWKIILFAVVLFAALPLAGCSEDKPAGPPTGEKEKKAEPEKDKEAEKGKKEEAAKTEEGEKAGKPGEVGDGEKAEFGKVEEGKTPDDGAGERAKAIEAAAQSAKAQLDRTLRKVTTYGVTGPIGKTMEAIVKMVPAEVQADLGKLLDEGMQELAVEGDLKNMDWLDTSRGIGFVFEGKDKPLVAIPTISKEKFLEALPEGREPDENQGYQMKDSYVLPMGKFLFVSDTYRTIELIEGDLKLELTRLSTDKVLLVVVGGESMKILVSSALDEMERTLGENMPMQQEQKEFLAKFFNFVKEIVGEIELVTLTLDLDRDDLVIRYELKTVDGSKLAASCASLKPGTFEAASYLPAKSYLVMAQHTPFESVRPWMSRYVDMVATAWKLKESEKGDFAKMYTRLMSLFGPDSAVAVYSDSSFPLAFSSVTQAKGGIESRDLIYGFYKIIFDRALEDLPPDQRQMFANRSLKEVVDSFAPVLQNLGIGIKMDTEQYQGGVVDFLVFTFDWDKLDLPPSAVWMREVIKGRLGGALGFSKEYMVMTFGPNPIVRAKEVLDKTQGLKLAELVGPEVADGKYVGLFALSFDKLVSGLLEIGVVAQFMETEPWLMKVREMKQLVVLAGLQKGGVWVETVVGLKSVIEAFDEPLREAMASEKKADAPPTGDTATPPAADSAKPPAATE